MTDQTDKTDQTDQIDTICKNPCKDICSENCNYNKVTFDDCKRCPLNGLYKCNIKSFVNPIEDDCDVLCKENLCNEIDTASRVLGECSKCPLSIQDGENEIKVKCNKTTDEYKQIRRNYVANLRAYENSIIDLENIQLIKPVNPVISTQQNPPKST